MKKKKKCCSKIAKNQVKGQAARRTQVAMFREEQWEFLWLKKKNNTTNIDETKQQQQREKSQISCQVFFLFLIFFFFWFLWWFLVFFAALNVLFFTLQIRPDRHKEKRTRTRAGWGTEAGELLMSSSRIFMALWAREWLLYWCILGQVQRCCFRFLSRTVYANRCECVRVCVCVCQLNPFCMWQEVDSGCHISMYGTYVCLAAGKYSVCVFHVSRLSLTQSVFLSIYLFICFCTLMTWC